MRLPFVPSSIKSSIVTSSDSDEPLTNSSVWNRKFSGFSLLNNKDWLDDA